jgi:RimJ/RimL family protein N-acetyltransferase
VIETDRLALTRPEASQADNYVRLWTGGDGGEIAPPNARALDAEAAWARLLRLIGHWATFGFGPFVVRERNTGQIVGEVGFARWHRVIDPAFDSCPEALWRIDRCRHGLGLAKEAAQAAALWLDAQGVATRTVCLIDVANAPSRRVAEHVGFRAFAHVLYRAHPVYLFERVTVSGLAAERAASRP